MIGGVLYHVLDFLLRIEAAMLGSLALDALGADLGQFRVFLDLDTPTLVVGQVPMQTVDLEERQDVDILLYVFDRHEMAARIQHDAPITKARLILDSDRRGGPSDIRYHGRAFDFRRQQLQERLHTVEQALRGLRLDAYVVFRNIKGIALVVYVECVVDCQRDSVGDFFIGYGDRIAGRRVQLSREKLGYGLRFRSGGIYFRALAQFEAPIILRKADRCGDDVNPLVVRLHRFGCVVARGDKAQHRARANCRDKFFHVH